MSMELNLVSDLDVYFTKRIVKELTCIELVLLISGKNLKIFAIKRLQIFLSLLSTSYYLIDLFCLHREGDSTS